MPRVPTSNIVVVWLAAVLAMPIGAVAGIVLGVFGCFMIFGIQAHQNILDFVGPTILFYTCIAAGTVAPLVIAFWYLRERRERRDETSP